MKKLLLLLFIAVSTIVNSQTIKLPIYCQSNKLTKVIINDSSYSVDTVVQQFNTLIITDSTIIIINNHDAIKYNWYIVEKEHLNVYGYINDNLSIILHLGEDKSLAFIDIKKKHGYYYKINKYKHIKIIKK